MTAIPSVLVIGGTTFDQIIYLDELPKGVPTTIHQCRLQETTGSTGTGKAVALKQLNVPVHLISACGDDQYGTSIKNYLNSKNISYDIFLDPAGTERHVNLMNTAGKRISIFITNSSDTIDFPANYLQQQLNAHDIIVLNIISYCRQWASQIVQCGKPIWTDLHDYNGTGTYQQSFIDTAQYIHLCSDNLTDYKSLMHRLIDEGKKLVVCTHGKKGASLLSTDEGWIDVPALEVPVVDTNGAGDNFFAGFLYGWLCNQPLARCMFFGSRAAASCVQSQQIVSPQLRPSLFL